MAKRRTGPPPGLPPALFDQLFKVLSRALRVIADRAAASVLGVLEQHAADIAACTLLQLHELETRLHGSHGVQLHDALRKAAMLGLGQIKPHVYRNPGVTWAKLVRLPAQDLQNLNDPNYKWAIRAGSRNKILQVASKDLTAPSTKVLSMKLISRFSVPEALPVSRQDDPRPRPVPRYYKMLSADPDPMVRGTVVLVCQLGNSVFKVRLVAGDVALIQTALLM